MYAAVVIIPSSTALRCSITERRSIYPCNSCSIALSTERASPWGAATVPGHAASSRFCHRHRGKRSGGCAHDGRVSWDGSGEQARVTVEVNSEQIAAQARGLQNRLPADHERAALRDYAGEQGIRLSGLLGAIQGCARAVLPVSSPRTSRSRAPEV